MNIKHRSIFWMAILSIVTLGIYMIYWAVKTKNEIKSLGADIPTAWLLIIPFGNIYFWYQYASGFAEYVKKGSTTIEYFIVAILPYLLAYFRTLIGLNLGTTKVSLEIGHLSYIIQMLFFSIQIAFIPLVVFQTELNKLAKKGHHTAS